MRLGELVVRGWRTCATGILPVLSWRYWFPKRTLGQRGERAAAKFLKRQGYKILATGDRLKHRDELDIVAADGRTVVFIEVKTRSSQAQGHPAEAVDAAKQRQLTKLAVTFLKRHRLLDYPARFDVIAITWPENVRRPQIEHIQNAFEAAGKWEFYS
ncbi:MAG: YraN family protein [Pirellulales bacterium]|nr:YraN family protein [Pirellulales bacterium]